MEHNRYNSPYYNRGRHNPYERRLERNQHFDRPSGQYRGQHFESRRPIQDRRIRNYNRYPRENYYNPERTFDHSGREMFDNQAGSSRQNIASELPVTPQISALEQKAKNFLHMVLSQEGVRSKLIFLQTAENSLQTLQGTVDNCQLRMVVEQDSTGNFVLKIDQEEIAKGSFATKQEAKHNLADQALTVLKKDCFFITKKNEFEEVCIKSESGEADKSESHLEGSKAHQMMLKMGWGGKGLGINEQGNKKTVAETIEQNISRQGLGTDNVFKKIHKILEDYSKSDKMSLLKFEPDFTSEERSHIHKIASKFGLKSKSEGKEEQRRITITKKLNRRDLVYNLLVNDLENSLYRLTIPAKFEYLWHDEEDEDEAVGFQPHFSS